MSLRFSLNSFSKLMRMQTKLQSTMVAPKAHVPTMYHNRAELAGASKALFNRNDPRTYPRYLVAMTAACLFSLASANSFWYNHHHFDTEIKNDPHAVTHAERPVQMVRTFSNGIIMNAKRYETLRHYGLGVDKDGHKTSKEAL